MAITLGLLQQIRAAKIMASRCRMTRTTLHFWSVCEPHDSHSMIATVEDRMLTSLKPARPSHERQKLCLCDSGCLIISIEMPLPQPDRLAYS